MSCRCSRSSSTRSRVSCGGGRARSAPGAAPAPTPAPQPGARLTCQRALSSLLSRLHCIWITCGWQGPRSPTGLTLGSQGARAEVPQRRPEGTVNTGSGDSLRGEPGKGTSLAAAQTAEGNSQMLGLKVEWGIPRWKHWNKEGAVGTGEEPGRQGSDRAEAGLGLRAPGGQTGPRGLSGWLWPLQRESWLQSGGTPGGRRPGGGLV